MRRNEIERSAPEHSMRAPSPRTLPRRGKGAFAPFPQPSTLGRAYRFFAVDFRAVDFLAVDFLAVDLFAVDFLALAVDFLAVDFFAVDFLAVDFLAAGMAHLL